MSIQFKPKLKNYQISIIIPMLNEILSLKKTLKILNSIKCKKEFVVIISKKFIQRKNLKELKKLSNSNRNLNVYYQTLSYVGGAIIKGIEKSKFDYVAIMAADMETNPYDLNEMIKVSKLNYNKIISADRWLSKNSFKNYSLLKLFFNFLSQKIISLFFKVNIKDFTFAYRIYPRDILTKFQIDELKHGFALEMLLKPLKLGYEVISVPSKWKARNEGEPNKSFQTYISFFKVLIKILIKFK